MYYSTQVVDVVSEATQDGSTVLSYFSAPASGQHAEPGTSVDVSAATDQLLVRKTTLVDLRVFLVCMCVCVCLCVCVCVCV